MPFLSINLISSFCPQFQLSALISSFCTQKNFKFLHRLGLIDILSANQHGEIFLCILLGTKPKFLREVIMQLTFKALAFDQYES